MSETSDRKHTTHVSSGVSLWFIGFLFTIGATVAQGVTYDLGHVVIVYFIWPYILGTLLTTLLGGS